MWLSYNLSLGDRADTVLGAGGPEASHAGGHCEGDEGQKESQTQPAHRGGGAEPTNKIHDCVPWWWASNGDCRVCAGMQFLQL